MTPSVCCCLLIPSSLGNTRPQTFILSWDCGGMWWCDGVWWLMLLLVSRPVCDHWISSLLISWTRPDLSPLSSLGTFIACLSLTAPRLLITTDLTRPLQHQKFIQNREDWIHPTKLSLLRYLKKNTSRGWLGKKKKSPTILEYIWIWIWIFPYPVLCVSPQSRSKHYTVDE